jgi:phospholipid/cholesterol/gamma-HCH transport system ATP-binding protein
MSEEKDDADLEAEARSGEQIGPLPPIPVQLQPSDGQPRAAERTPGQWCAEHDVRAPEGSFQGRVTA